MPDAPRPFNDIHPSLRDLVATATTNYPPIQGYESQPPVVALAMFENALRLVYAQILELVKGLRELIEAKEKKEEAQLRATQCVALADRLHSLRNTWHELHRFVTANVSPELHPATDAKIEASVNWRESLIDRVAVLRNGGLVDSKWCDSLEALANEGDKIREGVYLLMERAKLAASATKGAGRAQPVQATLPDPIAAACGMKVANPKMPDAKIAKAVGVHPGTLSRSKEYQRAKSTAVGNLPPRGRKDPETGQIE